MSSLLLTDVFQGQEVQTHQLGRKATNEENDSNGVMTRRRSRSNSAARLARITERKWSWFAQLTQLARGAFLPQGYPHTVSSDYLNYQKWDTTQAFCSSITGSLAAQAVLKGYGVGNANATAAAAVFTQLLRDGTGMITSISFASWQGSDLDNNAKQFRILADILNDAAIFLELISPLFPSVFVAIVCFASFARAMVGVAGGATRAAMRQHQARANNTGDVSAKDGSQETLVNLVALLVNLVLVRLVANSQTLVWVLFAIFTGLHIFANYKAVRSLELDRWNGRRVVVAMRVFVQTNQVPGISSVNKAEPLFYSPSAYRVRLGVSVAEAIRACGEAWVLRCMAAQAAPNPVCVPVPGCDRCLILVREMSPSRSVVQAYLTAAYLAAEARRGHLTGDSNLESMLVTAAASSIRFSNQAQAIGWHMDSSHLYDFGWRIRTGDSGSHTAVADLLDGLQTNIDGKKKKS